MSRGHRNRNVIGPHSMEVREPHSQRGRRDFKGIAVGSRKITATNHLFAEAVDRHAVIESDGLALDSRRIG